MSKIKYVIEWEIDHDGYDEGDIKQAELEACYIIEAVIRKQLAEIETWGPWVSLKDWESVK